LEFRLLIPLHGAASITNEDEIARGAWVQGLTR